MSDDQPSAWATDHPPMGEPSVDWREQRRQERAQRRGSRRGGGAWIGGLVLIGLGLLFMAQNAGIMVGARWWALFLMIPAIALFGAAWRAYTWFGGFNPTVTGPLVGALVLTTISMIFLLGLDWRIIWPVFLIFAGLGTLAGGAFQRR